MIKRFSCAANENKYFAHSIELLKDAVRGTHLADAVFFEDSGEFSVPKAAKNNKLAYGVYVLEPQN